MPRDDEPGGPDRLPDFHEIETVLRGPDEELVETPMPAGAGPKGRGFAGLDEFVRSLVEIGLITAVELERFAADSAEGVLGLSRALVKAGKLTPYQAAAVYQKKSRGLLIGNYFILDKLGQGGMGVVFKARHRPSGRVGALKILPPSFSRDRDAVLRFRREIEAAGRLNHPNVVAALDSDEDRGVHFLVMEYVEGRDLDHVVGTRGPLPVEQAVECLIQAARGLEAAHAKGIIHRDIKPGNLILDSSGALRVLDLGLARIVDANNPFSKTGTGRLTQSGMYMGTVDYMAPEQAEDAHRVDHRADIYSLGCTFYFLLTGGEPFPGETILKRLMAHMEREAPSIRTGRPEVSPALEACYQKMMAKRPDDRPRSMTEVIALLQASKLPPDDVVGRVAPPPKSRTELKVFNEAPLKRAGPPKTKAEPSIFARREEREGVPISHELNLEDLVMDVRSEKPAAKAKPSTTLREPLKRSALPAFRSQTRHTRFGLVAVVAAGLLVAAFLGIVVSRRPLAVTENESPSSLADADETENTNPVEITPPSQPEPTLTTIFDGTTGRGWMLCNRAPVPPQNIQPDGLNPHGTGSYLVVYNQKLGDFTLDFDYKLTQGCNSGVFLRVSDLNDPVQTGIEVALDDTRRGDDRDSGAFYGLVAPRIYSQKPTGQWNHMTITAEGPQLAVSLNDTEVSTINLDLWTVRGKRPDGSDHRAKNRTVATMARSGYLGFQDLGGDCWFKNIFMKTNTNGSRSSASSSSLSGRSIPSPARRAEPAGEPYVETARFVAPGHPDLKAVRLLPDGKTLLIVTQEKPVRLWDVATGKLIRRLWHPANVLDAALLPDGRRVVTDCADGYVRVWDLQTGEQIRRLVKHFVKAPLTLAISPDGRSILAGGNESVFYLWDVVNGTEIRQFEGQTSRVVSLAFSRDGRRFLSGGADGIVRVGELKNSGLIKPLERHSDYVFGLALAADGRHAVSSSVGQLILWDLDAKSVVRQIDLDRRQVATVAFRNERALVFATHVKESNGGARDEGVLGTWDLESSDPPRILYRGKGHLSLALMPGGGIVTGGVDGTARIWQPSLSMARARDLVREGKDEEAIIEIGKAVTSRPNDARLLIERGRLQAETGRSSEADADFTRAAQLAPDNPQLFLDDGWWVAGPYGLGISAKRGIEEETAPDPSRPPPPSDGKPRVWRRAPAGMLGHVDLASAIPGDHVSAYALAIVYSQVQRTAILFAGSDDIAQIWLNGRLELECPRFTGADGYTLAVTLKPGRNMILAKVANTGGGEHGFHLRFGDEPGDFVHTHFRSSAWAKAADAYKQVLKDDPDNGDADVHHFGAEALANLGRWKEAVAGFKIARALQPTDHRLRDHLMKCYSVLNDLTSYRPLCRDTIEDLGKNSDPKTRDAAIRTASVMPGALSDYSSVVLIAKKAMDDRSVAAYQFHTYGALLFRAKQNQSAITFLNRAIDARKGKDDPLDWVFMAMARHRLKLATDKDAFKKAVSLAKGVSSDWEQSAELHALLEEARQQLGLP